VESGQELLKVSNRTLHHGRINPMLFGNFIELLDDLTPGMWAEMLNDRGFEGIIPPANWVYFDGSPTCCDRAWDLSHDWTTTEVDKSFTGRKCAKIVANGDRPSRLSQSGLAVKQGTRYHMSGWIRSEGSVRMQVALETPAPDGSNIELATADPWEPTAQYTRFSATLQPKASSDRVAFVVRGIGKGTIWADQLSLMPADNRRGWRTDVTEAVKASRPSLIRWGGSVVDPGAYRWKNGIGERDLRQPFLNVNWGRIDSNDVGIDEFCEFCALVEAAPLVCVSFSDGPASAADLVQYCNGGPETTWGGRRATNGHRAPHRVKYWQLGNEISGDDAAHSARCRDFIAAMKKGRSEHRVAGIVSVSEGAEGDREGPGLPRAAPLHARPGLLRSRLPKDFRHDRRDAGVRAPSPRRDGMELHRGRLGPASRQDADARRGAAQRALPQPALPLLPDRGHGLPLEHGQQLLQRDDRDEAGRITEAPELPRDETLRRTRPAAAARGG
jgi:hypothetical protein